MNEENEDSEMWRAHNEDMRQMRERRRVGFENVLDQLIKRGHIVKQMSLYQFRVDDVLDVYPSNKRWHDIVNNRRGDLRVPLKSAAAFLEKILKQYAKEFKTHN